MEVEFQILYHPIVIKEDIPKLPARWKTRIQQAIEKKLVSFPAEYGKPLRRSLNGYRKLRVGDYRVVFRIRRKEVLIFAIKHRSLVYEVAEGRLS